MVKYYFHRFWGSRFSFFCPFFLLVLVVRVCVSSLIIFVSSVPSIFVKLFNFFFPVAVLHGRVCGLGCEVCGVREGGGGVGNTVIVSSILGKLFLIFCPFFLSVLVVPMGNLFNRSVIFCQEINSRW